MEGEKIREVITRAGDELLARIRDSYATRNGWNTARKYIITVVNYEKQDSGRKKQLIDGTGAS